MPDTDFRDFPFVQEIVVIFFVGVLLIGVGVGFGAALTTTVKLRVTLPKDNVIK